MCVNGLGTRPLFAGRFPMDCFVGVKLCNGVLAVVVANRTELREDFGFFGS